MDYSLLLGIHYKKKNDNLGRPKRSLTVLNTIAETPSQKLTPKSPSKNSPHKNKGKKVVEDPPEIELKQVVSPLSYSSSTPMEDSDGNNIEENKESAKMANKNLGANVLAQSETQTTPDPSEQHFEGKKDGYSSDKADEKEEKNENKHESVSEEEKKADDHEDSWSRSLKDLEDDFDEKKGKPKIHMQGKSIGGAESILMIPNMNRVPSRRLSQLGMRTNYNIVTPMEKDFDLPDLIDNRMLRDVEDEEEMDYSHDGNVFTANKGGMSQVDELGNEGDEIYFTGIIDILQKYNQRKQLENFFRGLHTDTSTISAVPPEQYSQRMFDFLKDKIL